MRILCGKVLNYLYCHAASNKIRYFRNNLFKFLHTASVQNMFMKIPKEKKYSCVRKKFLILFSLYLRKKLETKLFTIPREKKLKIYF